MVNMVKLLMLLVCLRVSSSTRIFSTSKSSFGFSKNDLNIVEGNVLVGVRVWRSEWADTMDKGNSASNDHFCPPILKCLGLYLAI